MRELVLVTSEAISQTQDKQTQTALNRLTIWLMVFTVVLVCIGVFKVWKTFYDAPDGPAAKPCSVHKRSVRQAIHSLHA